MNPCYSESCSLKLTEEFFHAMALVVASPDESRARPPNPVTSPGKCREVTHKSCVELLQDEEAAVLHHTLTGERVCLPSKTDDGTLHFSPGTDFGFVIISGQPHWCSKYLKLHCFEDVDSKQKFAVQKLQGKGTGLLLRWLDEIIGRRWLELQLHDTGVFRVLEMDQPCGGCNVFWSLRCVLEALRADDCTVPVTQSHVSTWMRKAWKNVLQEHLGPQCRIDEHVLCTDRQQQTAASSSSDAPPAELLESISTFYFID